MVGASDQSHYRLSVEQHEKRRALAAVDREALQAVRKNFSLSGCLVPRHLLHSPQLAAFPCPYQRVPARFSFVATRQVLEGPCCTRPGSCASLRTGLNGFESLGRDLCNTGQNLCDVEGRLIHLALVNEASAAVVVHLICCTCCTHVFSSAVLLLCCCCAAAVL